MDNFQDKEERRKMKRGKESNLNYETIIDSYLPPVPKVTTDQLLYPEQFVEEYKLTQLYRSACRKEFDT